MPAKSLWPLIRRALRDLDPSALLQEADRSICLALVAEREDQLREMEGFFAPPYLRPRKAEEVRQRLLPFLFPLSATQAGMLPGCDVVVAYADLADRLPSLPAPVFVFRPEQPGAVVPAILRERWNLALPLAKNFLPFRRDVQSRWIRSVALENGLWGALEAASQVSTAPYSLAHAVLQPASGRELLPADSPNEAADDGGIAFLTANQFRLAFLLAASSDSAVGFREQRGQLTAMAAAAIGLRALSRRWTLPAQGVQTIISEGLLAYLGSYAAAKGLSKFHALGQSFSRDEKSAVSEEAYRLGRQFLEEFLEAMASRARSVA